MINKQLLADLQQLSDIQQQNQEILDNNEQEHQQNQNQYQSSNIKQQYQTSQMPILANNKSKLLTIHAQQFLKHMNSVSHAIDKTIEQYGIRNNSNNNNKNSREYWKELFQEGDKDEIVQNVNKSNQYIVVINRQISAIAKFIKNLYAKKFPQLQSLVTYESHYCKAVYQIQNNTMDGITGEKYSYLSQHQKIALKISISANRDPLPAKQLNEIKEAAKIVIQLDGYHDTLMIYLQSYMNVIAPNVCQLVGSLIASKLIGAVGGIQKLAGTPACNIQVLGGTRSAQTGLSQLQRNHSGVFGTMQVVKDAPSKFRMKLIRMLATNTAKCARADYLGTSPNLGIQLRQDMYDRFQKVQEEGGLMAQQKPMEIPDIQPKKKRGGKRHRKNKQLYQMTEVRKQQNRIKFGEQAEQQIDEGVGLGMLSKSGMGKLKVQIKKQKVKSSKKMQKRMNKKSGMQSSLNLGALQGIQLINPAQLEEGRNQGGETYFKKQSGFRTVLNNKMMK